MDKAPDAFRTISEVADDLDVPQHVLRFWETRFAQIKPMKRSGGRRYYRPDDVNLLRGIRRLLYGEGYTIRGVQRILREHGIKSVQSLSGDATVQASALFDGPTFEDEADTDSATLLETDHENSADADIDEDADAAEIPVVRGAMDFSPQSPLRPASTDRAPPVAIVPKPVMPKPVQPTDHANGSSGAAAYAPPSVRQAVRPGDHGKLRAALDDLIGARALIDRVLKDN